MSRNSYTGLAMTLMAHTISLLFLSFTFGATIAARTQCPSIKAHWWPNNPYIHLKDNKPTGILPLIFSESAKYCCNSSKFNIDWMDNHKSYENALYDIERLKTLTDGASNNETLNIWLPFSLMHYPSHTDKLTILESNLVLIMVIETRMDKLINVYNGFKRIFPQILCILLLTILFGILMWIAETTTNSQFPKPFPRGAWHGFWWSIVTVTTVGYGDKTPRTGAGKMVGVVWMVTGLILFPVLTAEVTSILTDTSYSLSLKKAGALKNSLEMREAISQGAFGQECINYSECLTKLKSGEIDLMLVDVHVAPWLPKAETNLVQKGSFAVKIPINGIVLKKDKQKWTNLFSCISSNSSLITETLITVHKDSKFSEATGVIFSTEMKELSFILLGIVVGIYLIVLIGDLIIRNKQKKTKIGDFREGVFMENQVIKNGSQQELKDFENPQEAMIQLIKRQKLQLVDMQASVEELEKKICR